MEGSFEKNWWTSSIVISLIFTSMGPSGETPGAAGQEPCSWGGLLPAPPCSLLPAPTASGFFCPQTPKKTTRECYWWALSLLSPAQPSRLLLDTALHHRPTAVGAHSSSGIQHPLLHGGFRQTKTPHLHTEPPSPFQKDLPWKAQFPTEAMPRQEHFS